MAIAEDIVSLRIALARVRCHHNRRLSVHGCQRGRVFGEDRALWGLYSFLDQKRLWGGKLFLDRLKDGKAQSWPPVDSGPAQDDAVA